MVYCKLIPRIYVVKLSKNIRTFSVVCNNVDTRNYLNTKLCYKSPPVLHNARHLSMEGFTRWQEQIYTGISNSYPVNVMQEGLLALHDFTGLSWWTTIVLSTALVRTLMTLPLTVYQNYILAKVENISVELKDMVNELKKETTIAKKAYNLTDKQAVILYKRSMKKQWQNLIVRDNCHPFKASLLIWVQIPIWVCMSFALRNLVYMNGGDPSNIITFMELSVGGVGWIPNLTEPDRSWILPVSFGLTNLSIIEIQRMSKLRQPSKVYNTFTNVFRIFSIIMIPVAASVPSCMCLYWMTSSILGLTQNLVLLSPSLRRKLKIPYRWDRTDPRKNDLINHIPSASLPFALGSRSCIGKKIAMLQISELIKQVTNNFDLKFIGENEVKPVTSQILVPNKKVEIKLTLQK